MHIVMYSGGLASWYLAHQVAEVEGADRVLLLFCDTKAEHPDLYRFLRDGAAAIKCELVEIADGRTPFDVFDDVKFIGNTRIDPCSRILKRELARNWIEDYFQPDEIVLHVGLDWTETNRIPQVKSNWLPFTAECRLADPPYPTRDQMAAAANRLGIAIPQLYADGFPRNNCHGACVKAGIGQWRKLLDVYPVVYKDWEDREEKFRQDRGKDVSILRDRRGGTTKTRTLRNLRLEVEGGRDITAEEQLDIGGCGCFSDVGEEGQADES